MPDNTGMANTKRIEVWVTTEQFAGWTMARGIASMSAWIKSIVDKEAARIIAEPRADEHDAERLRLLRERHGNGA